MIGKKIKVISEGKKNLSKMESFRQYIGRTVISKSGDKVGKVHDIMFSGNNVGGIIVMKKLSKFFIDKKFLGPVSDRTVMLSIDPVLMLVGKEVFDADGKKMGKVVDISRKTNSNNFDYLFVKRKLYSRMMKIPKSEVDVAKKNIILKKVY